MKEAIRAYETNSKEKYSVRWDPEKAGSFSIEETFKDIEESTEIYLAKGRAEDGFKNRIRGCLRKFVDRSESLVLFLNFLPSDTYGSLICGGVSVILKAASRIGHARESVLDALAEIPEIIANAGILDSMYQGAPRLKNAVSALYVATLLALEHILLWFHQNAASMTLYPLKSLRNLTAGKEKFSSRGDMTTILRLELETSESAQKQFGGKLNYANKR